LHTLAWTSHNQGEAALERLIPSLKFFWCCWRDHWNHDTMHLSRYQMPEVIICGEKKGTRCSRASCNPKIIVAHLPSQRKVDVNYHKALKCPLQNLSFDFPPLVHLCHHPNLSKADNTDQRSWLAVDQVMGAKNPLADFRTPHKVNDHARIQKEQLVLRGL